ncbi:MAG: DUF2779 domain-containing protein [Verrucomicrobia bacterium]|nr:DUF2779 domain-containing protein [Verrucomicrobiota bacterium]
MRGVSIICDRLSPSANAQRDPYISKSKFLWGRQCPKLLWHAYHAKHLIPEPDPNQQAIFDQGHEVGQLAKRLFPGGIEVAEVTKDFDHVLQQTRQALRSRRPLFEPGFAFNGGFARADILNPVGDDQWDLVEVKSSTSVKDVNLLDVAFQAYVLASAGLRLRRCVLMCINPDYVRRGDIDPSRFFQPQDVTAEASGLSRQIEDQLNDLAKVIGQPACPEMRIGPHCDSPYTCPLHDHCWSFLPAQNVTTLYRGGKKSWRLFADGITGLADIPAHYRLTANQTIQRRAAISGQPHLDRPALAAFLKRLEYPISYLDFETFATAIPPFDGVRPFQQIPFQFSLHVVRSAGAEPEHFGFLAEGRVDPRPEFMRQLKTVISSAGSIVVYNASFETNRIAECCDFLPEYRSWYRQLEPRIVDLLLPFRGFRYYHPAQRGSASMKAVLPALTGRGYEELEIQEGGTASLEFLRVTFGEVSDQERQRVRRALEQYCGQDTLGMIWIVDDLWRLIG